MRLKADWRAVLREAIKADGRSWRALSLDANLNHAMISEWLRESKNHKQKEPSFASLAAVANVLNLSLDRLAESDSASTMGGLLAAPVSQVRVAGFIQAGIWQEPAMIDLDDDASIPYVPHKLYHGMQQFAWRVRGPSVNKIAQDGDYIIAVKIIDLGTEPDNNAAVVCERRRGDMYEYTVKRIQYTPTGTLLVPDSTDKRFQEPVWMSAEAQPDEEVEVTHLVIGVFRPI